MPRFAKLRKPKSLTVIVAKDSDGSLSHRQTLSIKKEKPTESKPTKETYESWGIPLTVISKVRTVRKKLGIMNQKKEVTTNPQQHEKMLQKMTVFQ